MRHQLDNFDRAGVSAPTVKMTFDLRDPEQVDVYLRLHRMERNRAVELWINQRGATPFTCEIPVSAFEGA